MISRLSAPILAVLGCSCFAACSSSSTSTPAQSDSGAPTQSESDGGEGEGDGGAAACSPVTPEGYLYRTEAVDAFPPCLIDDGKPVDEAVDLGIRITDTESPTVQFGGDDDFCEAKFDGCHLRSGCGIFVGFGTTGYPAV